MRIPVVLAFIGAICLALLHATPAQALLARTWVSGVGDDANNCQLTTPCKTFAGALSKTDTGGEIACLGAGGFGGVTISKSVSIICKLGTDGVAVSGGNAITVNTPANSVVILQGLDIDGLGTAAIGINFTGAGALYVEDCLIRGFNSAASGAGVGIEFAPTGVGALFVSDSHTLNNGTGSNGAGIEVRPGTGGSATVVLNRAESNNNVTGFKADGSATSVSPAIKASIVYSGFSRNGFSGIAATTAATGGSVVNVMVNFSLSATNGTNGVSAEAPNAVVEVGSSTISGNTTGIRGVTGGVVSSYANTVFGNITGITGVAPGVAYTFGNNAASGNTNGNGTAQAVSMF